jgi:hypothetical protein
MGRRPTYNPSLKPSPNPHKGVEREVVGAQRAVPSLFAGSTGTPPVAAPAKTCGYTIPELWRANKRGMNPNRSQAQL